MKKFLSFIFPNGFDDSIGIIERSRTFLAFITSVVAVGYSVILGVYIGLIHGMIIHASINFTMAAFFTLIALMLRNPERSETGRLSLVALTTLFFLYNLWTGGVSGTGYLWGYILPPGYYFLIGRRNGTIGNVIYLIAAVCAMIWPQTLVLKHFYAGEFVIRYCAVYLMLWMISFFYEYSRENSERALLEEVEERIKSERALGAAKNIADEANLAKSLFLANMSHEIRTPMNGVLGLGSLLSETELDIEQKEYVDSIMNSADSLMTLINDILDYSKIEANKIDLDHIPFDIRTTVEGAVDLLTFKAQEKGVELSLLLSACIPRRLVGDPGRIRQILVNLVGNAVKFTEIGEVVVSVSTIRQGNGKVMLMFNVKDSGIGIPEESMSKLFQLFSQVDPGTTRKFGGTGLGLAISKRLAELMGGEIGVESQLGFGSKFWFTAELELAPEPIAEENMTRVDLEGRRVFISEVPSTSRSILLQYLADLKMICEYADNARDSLDALRNSFHDGKSFDVILLDSAMPAVSGMNMAKIITSENLGPQKPKIVLITSVGMRGDINKLQSAGINAYLSKPFKLDQLAECLRIVQAESIPEQSVITKHTVSEIQKTNRLKILFAEDNKVNQLVFIKILEKAGYTCDLAVNGMVAVEAVDHSNYDIIFMDVQMPVLSGYDATRAIRSAELAAGDCRHVPIIAMTANAMKGDREKCIEAGMDDYLSKPINREEFLEKIRHWSNYK